MLQGLHVEENPLETDMHRGTELEIMYEDEWLSVVNKPAGMLSVPGKSDIDSVYGRVRRMYPEATGPMIVHRLDMATSGLILIAKTKEVHQTCKHSSRTGRCVNDMSLGWMALWRKKKVILNSPSARIRKTGRGRWSMRFTENLP